MQPQPAFTHNSHVVGVQGFDGNDFYIGLDLLHLPLAPQQHRLHRIEQALGGFRDGLLMAGHLLGHYKGAQAGGKALDKAYALLMEAVPQKQ